MYALGLPLGPSPHQVSAPLVRHEHTGTYGRSYRPGLPTGLRFILGGQVPPCGRSPSLKTTDNLQSPQYRGLFIITYPILGIPYYDCGSNGPQNSILNIKAPLVGPRGSFSESGSRGSTSDDRCLIKLGTPPKP